MRIAILGAPATSIAAPTPTGERPGCSALSSPGSTLVDSASRSWRTAVLAGLMVMFAGLAAGCGEDDRPANWSYIHAAVIVPGCTTSSCHTDFNAQAGVRLSDRENAYNILTGRTCNENPDNSVDGNFVVPGEPENSRLMYLLIGDNVARAMPPDRPLPDVDIDLIENWILAGAPCD